MTAKPKHLVEELTRPNMVPARPSVTASENSDLERDGEEGEDDEDSEKRRERRLLQNRKSAKKCRLKKKKEFSVLFGEVDQLKLVNKDLQDKINEITLMLYSKIDENNALTRKVDQLSSTNQ